MPIFKKFASDYPNSESLLRKIITLPTHEGLTSDDIALIIKSVKSMGQTYNESNFRKYQKL